MAAAEIACTLGVADIGSRLARIQQLTRARLRTHRLQGSTLRLSYGVEAAPELADLVELVIVGPPQQGGDAQWLFSQFLPACEPAICGCSAG